MIGASAAGLLAAQQVAQRRVPVQVFERTEHPTPHSRTLIVTPELQRVLGRAAASATVNTVHTLELCSNGRTVPIRLREPDLVVERSELVRVLACQATEAGAQLLPGQEFTGVQAEGTRTLVQIRARATDQTRCVAAQTIVAADGVRSQVARSLGVPRRPTVTVIQARVARSGIDDPGVGQVWFVPHDTPYFYWLCPESRYTAAVGIVDVDTREARRKLDRFLADRDYEPLEYQAALIPLYTPDPSPVQRVGQTDVLFVGDAAGQVKVTTIGGTVTGLRSAQAAARAIVNGTRYTSELGGVTRELRLHLWIRSLMNRFGDREYDALLRLLAGRAGRLLEIHNRDQLAGVFWSIMARQPGLPLLAARVLWRAGFQP